MQTYPRATPKLFATVVLVLSAASLAVAAGMDRGAILEAIHDLENPRNLTRRGPCGELGAYQFREATWREYTSEPFARANERPISDYVAIQHYEWIKRRLEQAHVPVTAYTIALAWNGGIRAAVTGHASRAARDYAERAANLASVFSRQQAVADSR